MRLNTQFLALCCASLIILAGCGGGGGSGESPGVAQPNSVTEPPATPVVLPPPTSAAPASSTGFFDAKVEPYLGFCRTCHIAGGVGAENVNGQKFVLSNDSNQDYSNVQAAWGKLGKGVVGNRLLSMPSDAAQGHSGGQPWTVGSAPYSAMATQLRCWDNPSSCTSMTDNGGDNNSGNNELPLLGSSHARSYMATFCEGQPDSAILPDDPRELIRPGVNKNRAVAFNTYWQKCTGAGPDEFAKPKTCGDYRSRKSFGEELVQTEAPFKLNGYGFVTARRFNDIWRRWGLKERPANFDAQLRERYGLAVANYPNPYPLPGEDPNQTNGGTGQLPVGLAQTKKANGSYSGTITITCSMCHSSEIKMLENKGEEAYVAGLGTMADLGLFLNDSTLPLPMGLNNSRGVTNAMGLSGLLIALVDPKSMNFYFDEAARSLFISQMPFNTTGTGDAKSPPWWNASHRPRKFWDGGYSYDATRLDSAIMLAPMVLESADGGKNFRQLAEGHSTAMESYIESLEAPHYPGEIDEALAKQGAILFHTKNMWANDANKDIPAPPTNGSCAGCHGAYSPRYVNDPSFLENPNLAGIAGYIAPLEQIRTDKARYRGFSKRLLDEMSTNWFSYPEGSAGYVSPDQMDRAQLRAVGIAAMVNPEKEPKGACTWQGDMPDDVKGYLAPPLHGIWATAPYLHNGSIPDIWSLLKPEDRPVMWRRKLSEGEGKEHGFDTRFDAYDQQKMGWKYDAVPCNGKGVPYLSCQPAKESWLAISLIDFANTLSSINTLSYLLNYQSTPPVTRSQVEARKIYNTYYFGKSNKGHDFTAVLTDQERMAIIEYLKTL